MALTAILAATTFPAGHALHGRNALRARRRVGTRFE
jgi:hypothetical protein